VVLSLNFLAEQGLAPDAAADCAAAERLRLFP
jgi:hypothetical protein